MLDPEFLANNFEYAQEQLARRGFDLNQETVEQYTENKARLTDIEKLRADKNASSTQIGQLMKEGRRDEAILLREQGREFSAEIAKKEKDYRDHRVDFGQKLLAIPNLPDERTPDGKDETANVILSKWGAPRQFDFTPLDHVDVATRLGILDLGKSVDLAGPRFNVLKKEGSALQRGLINFMLDKAIQAGYDEVTVPYLVNAETMQGTGQLPKFEDDLFKTNGLYLIPTAEVPVTNLYANMIIPADDLPIKHTAYTECFRKEAGSAGRDTRGILRQHQFPKVELVQITKPESSWQTLEDMTDQAASILEDLELPHRKVALCAGDLGFAAAWTTDLEVWLPTQDRYREVSSVSNTLDFQSRRMNLRMRSIDEKKSIYPHTLNGSALAVGRTLLCIIENNQQEDGSVVVPEVLQPYVPFKKITAK